MFKTLGRFINLKTIVIIAIYIFLKKEDKSITTYEIKEESMSPELLPEDYVIAVKTSEPFNRGDIVVFENNEKSISVVKRVVGLPGETISATDGQLYINQNHIIV